MSDHALVSRARRVIGALLFITCGTLAGNAFAAQPATEPGAFVQAAASVTVQPEDSGFGGYFCCEAGGVAPGADVEAGWFVADWFSVRAEVAIPASDIIHIYPKRLHSVILTCLEMI